MDIPKIKQNTVKKLFSPESNDLEIEARFGAFENKKFTPFIDDGQYHRAMIFFTSKSEFYEHTVGHQIIQFSPENNTKKVQNTDKNFQNITHVEYVKKTKTQTVDIPDYNFRISASKETFIDDGDSFKYEEIPRYRTRHTFVSKDAALKIEVSTVFHGENASSNIELERLDGCKHDVFMMNVKLILSILQDTEIPISISETKKVIKMFPKKFLGIQPVAIKRDFDQKNIEFAVTKKLDGIRYLMTVMNENVYIVHKNGTVKKLPYVISNVDNIIMDGELFQGVYHIFDVISNDSLKDRLNLIKEFTSRLEGYGNSVITAKDYIFADKDNDIRSIMGGMVIDLDDKYDGLIVVKTKGGYYDSSPLKWKKTITFDFEIMHVSDGNYNLNMGSRKGTVKFGEIHVDSEVRIPDHTIMECYYQNSQWNMLKSRPDKTSPNYETTVKDNWECVQDPLVFSPIKQTKQTTTKPAKQPTREKSCFYDMRRFHNYIKRRVIATYPSNSVLDLACGKGGDLPKYIDSNIKYIEGYDINADSIEQANKRKEHFLGKVICKNFNINLHQNDLLTNPVSSDVKFDLVTCNFAYHYFYKSPECITKSIIDNTRKGSVLILSLLDSDKISLCDQEELKIEMVDQERISVYIKDSVLNEPTVEYLVPKKPLVEYFKNIGFGLIQDQNFSDFYNDWGKHGNSLSKIEMGYSFMNNVYVFKREF